MMIRYTVVKPRRPACRESWTAVAHDDQSAGCRGVTKAVKLPEHCTLASHIVELQLRRRGDRSFLGRTTRGCRGDIACLLYTSDAADE